MQLTERDSSANIATLTTATISGSTTVPEQHQQIDSLEEYAEAPQIQQVDKKNAERPVLVNYVQAFRYRSDVGIHLYLSQQLTIPTPRYEICDILWTDVCADTVYFITARDVHFHYWKHRLPLCT